MAIPDYQTVMLPLLSSISDKKEHSLHDVIGLLASRFSLSESEIEALLPSGKQTIFHNRVGWAKTYLAKAKLLEATKRGHFKITERGLKILKQKLKRIDNKFLKQFPEFVEFKSRKKKKIEKVNKPESEDLDSTPEESLESAFQKIQNKLAIEIIENIKSCSSLFFERLVVELLVKMGYGGTLQDAGEAIGKSGDGGIDGIIKEDRLGLDIIYLQAKRWEGSVGRPEVQKFAGALLGKQARKGVFITTSYFTSEAIEYVKTIESSIILVDGDELAELMIDYNLGVSIAETFEIKRIDSDYFIEE